MKTFLSLLLIIYSQLAFANSLIVYDQMIDYSCQIDSDCTVKNVGNCCGYFPKCVNHQSYADPNEVARICSQMPMASICGFEEIQGCQCVKNRCESKSNSPKLFDQLGTKNE